MVVKIFIFVKKAMKEIIEKITSWRSTVPGLAKILISILIIAKLVEIGDEQTILDNIDLILASAASILAAVSGLLDVLKKDKSD